MSIANRMKLWITGEQNLSENFGTSMSGTELVGSEIDISPSLVNRLDQMRLGVLTSMAAARRDLINRVEPACLTVLTCPTCQEKLPNEWSYVRRASGGDTGTCTDGNEG